MKKILFLIVFVTISISSFAYGHIARRDTINNRIIEFRTETSVSYSVSFPEEKDNYIKATNANKNIDRYKREGAMCSVIVSPDNKLIVEKVHRLIPKDKKELLAGEKILCYFLVDYNGVIKGASYIISNKVEQIVSAVDMEKIDRLLREILTFKIADKSVPYIMSGVRINF